MKKIKQKTREIYGSRKCDEPDLCNYYWYCDECAAYLNIQEGFNCETGEWKCTNCDSVNKINKDNIVL